MAIGTATAILGSAILGGVASNRAASTVAAGQQASAASQEAQFQQTRADAAPWREAGARALSQQEQLISPTSYQQYLESLNPQNFSSTPYYNFLLTEGIKARDRSAASRGMLLSGAQQKAISAYGQGLASTEYGNYFDRMRALRAGRANELASVAGTGQQTALELGRIGANTAANIGSSYANAAQAQGAGILGLANAATGGVNQWMYAKGAGLL